MNEQLFNAGRLMKQINDQLEKNANNNLREIGLTVSQLTVLRHLNHAEDGRSDAVAEFKICRHLAELGVFPAEEISGGDF